MTRRASACTQSDITRLIKGAKAAGIADERMTGIQLTREGAVLLFGDAKPAAAEENDWDKALGT